MRWILVVLMLAVCDPFTLEQPAGALPVGTRVEFGMWDVQGLVVRYGTVEAYAVRACWPGGVYPPGLDDVAYVVNYGDVRGARVVLNGRQIGVG
jgi:hypothetical protein